MCLSLRKDLVSPNKLLPCRPRLSRWSASGTLESLPVPAPSIPSLLISAGADLGPKISRKLLESVFSRDPNIRVNIFSPYNLYMKKFRGCSVWALVPPPRPCNPEKYICKFFNDSIPNYFDPNDTFWVSGLDYIRYIKGARSAAGSG